MNAAAPSCGRRFFPQASWATVPPLDVQHQLREAMARWGRPERFRVDNGYPWGSWSDLPPDLALWLIGLGIQVICIPPRQPAKNGVVERSQRTAKSWAEPGQCATAEELRARLATMDVIQREEYPSLQGRSRWETFPELKHSGRPYSRTWERGHWSLELVLAELAGYAVPRKVDCSGKVSVYGRNYYVSKLHEGKVVYVLLDPERREWVFTDVAGRQLRSQPAADLTRERIMSLTVCQRRTPASKRKG